MLRVTVELIPYGNENKKEIISIVDIINTGKKYVSKAGEDVYEYEFRYSDSADVNSGIFRAISLRGLVGHVRARNVWFLIRAVSKKICKYLEKGNYENNIDI